MACKNVGFVATHSCVEKCVKRVTFSMRVYRVPRDLGVATGITKKWTLNAEKGA